jgi:hypothetical protein
LQETLVGQATGRVGEHIVAILTHLLRARVSVEEKYGEIREEMKAWKPQLSGKSFHGKPELQTVCGGIEHVLTAQFEILMAQLEDSVTSAKFWNASVEDDDANDSGSLITSLSKTAVEFTVKEVRKTLARKADPFIKNATQDIGFRVHKSLHHVAVKSTTSVTDSEERDKLKAEDQEPVELVRTALRGLLAQLEATMQRSFESNLSGRVIKVSSSLLSQLHGGTSTFNELEEKAKEFDKLLSAKVIGTALTPGRVRLALPLDQLISQSGGSSDDVQADAFEKLTEAMSKDKKKLPFVLSFDAISQDGPVTTAKLEQWFVDNSTSTDRLQVNSRTKNNKVQEWVNGRIVAKCLQAGKIGEQLCGDRVASTLNTETEYRTNANASWCHRLCSTFQRVFCRSRVVLTRHENELGE